MNLYVLEASEAPWGDYGEMLRHGMAGYVRDSRSRIQLEGTGPFVPPITFPGVAAAVVTDAVKLELERDLLPATMFRPVRKKRIVKLAWHAWDLAAEEPHKYPAGGEPENYVLGRKHDPSVARALGDLWEVRAELRPGVQLPDGRFDPRLYDGEPIVRAAYWRTLYVSEAVKRWLERHLSEWVRLKRAKPG